MLFIVSQIRDNNGWGFPATLAPKLENPTQGQWTFPWPTEVRRNVFTQRVVNVWNSLPQKVVEVKTLCDFKKESDIVLGAKGIWGGGIRILNLMISHDHNEWGSKLEGLNGLLLLSLFHPIQQQPHPPHRPFLPSTEPQCHSIPLCVIPVPLLLPPPIPFT